jgi:hypothetical protein
MQTSHETVKQTNTTQRQEIKQKYIERFWIKKKTQNHLIFDKIIKKNLEEKIDELISLKI